MLTYKPKQCIYIHRYINILEAHRAPSMGFHTRSDVIMGLFGKKKKEEIKAPSCACSCGCADEKATESKNKCFAKAAEGIFCVKVLGAGCASCHKQYEYAKEAVKNMGISVEVEYITDLPKVMEYGVMSMPALVVNEKVVAMGKVLKPSDIEKILLMKA